jgi:ribosomal protein S18 acetylase RimI-like enzyme
VEPVLKVRKIVSTSALRACRTFLAQNPISNVLPLGDLYSPLFQVSDVFEAVENSQVVGICAIYRAFSTPSVVLGTGTQETKETLVREALREISSDFISLCDPNDVDIFKKYSTTLHHHHEQQMTANPPEKIECDNINVDKVRENELESLNGFYMEHGAEAWVPIQFKAGPYYCVRREDQIVSAAGVHLVTPQIAQLGNIVTDEAYRNRGFATACTETLATDLASKGRIISLFVQTENAPAIHIYEKLGFCKANNIAFLIMRKNAHACKAGKMAY